MTAQIREVKAASERNPHTHAHTFQGNRERRVIAYRLITRLMLTVVLIALRASLAVVWACVALTRRD